MQSNKKTKIERSIPVRTPKKLLEKIKKRGNGDFRSGLYRMDSICDLIEKDPYIILQKLYEEYVNGIKAFANDNHYEHFIESGLPAMLSKFNKTGKVDKNLFFPARPEKSIDKFSEEDENADESK